MSPSDSEIARLRRLYLLDPQNSLLRSKFLRALERSGLRYEARRLECGYWLEDRAQMAWEERIASWQCLSALNGRFPDPGSAAFFCGGRRLAFAVPFKSVAGGTWSALVFDTESGKALESFLVVAEERVSFFGGGEELLLLSDEGARLVSSEGESQWVEESYRSTVGEEALFGFEDGSLACWPRLEERFQGIELDLLGVDRELGLVLGREEEHGGLRLRSLGGEMLFDLGYGGRRVIACPGGVEFFVCLGGDEWRHCSVSGEGVLNEHDFEFSFAAVEHFRLCASRKAFCCFYEGVPRRFEYLEGGFSLREEGGVGMAQRSVKVHGSVWHPLADVAVVLSGSGAGDLDFWSVAGRSLLRVRGARFLGFSRSRTLKSQSG